ncbi:MAG: cation transporter [Ruminococcaceae bacterium]|nr:cation transporter [Oscillospiraceae bacterium]
MTEFLIRKFVKNKGMTDDPAVRGEYGKLFSVTGILCNVLLFLIKMGAGWLTASVSIMADAVNNLSDATSSIISLFGFKLASRPADEEHPYGHGRYEYLSGLMVSVLILAIGLELLRTGISKTIHPEPVTFGVVPCAILVISIAIKLWMMVFGMKIGNRINSGAITATASDSRNDVISTTAVLAAAVISHFTSLQLDGIIGIGVALFILYSGFCLVKDTLAPLLGKAPDPEMAEKIRQRILSYPGVLGTHDLMIHDYGPGRQFASVHVEMAAEDDVTESHDVIDNIERDFIADGLNLIVHFDPIITKDDAIYDIRHWLAEEVLKIDRRLTVHDLRIVNGPTHTNLIFDCVVPVGFALTDSEVKKRVSALVKEKYPTYYCVITIDKSYTPIPHTD